MLKWAARVILAGFVSLQISGGADEKSFYAARRDALMKKIGNSIAVLEGAPEPRAYTAFRQDNNFYYLTGVEVPNAHLLIDGIQHRSILFLPPRNKMAEQWEGPRLYPGTEAQQATGMDDVLDNSKLEDELARRKECRSLYIPFSPSETSAVSRDRAAQFDAARRNSPWDGRISREAAFEKKLQARFKSFSIENLSPFLDEMRRVKDAQEIEQIRASGRIGALGLKEAIRSARPGMYEYQLAAVAQLLFAWHGSPGFAFFPIVGSGPNSCLLHYSQNSRRMDSGDIVVMDFGSDYRYYASDVTRSFPVSGKFSEEQAKVYQIVLESQNAALNAVRPGATFADLESAVRDVLDRYSYSHYLTHAVGHYVGMSTHDVGRMGLLEPGVVIALEPGVYMADKNLGIRIEDTVLVTKNGYEILTGEAPKEMAEIEKLMTEKGVAEAIRN